MMQTELMCSGRQLWPPLRVLGNDGNPARCHQVTVLSASLMLIFYGVFVFTVFAADVQHIIAGGLGKCALRPGLWTMTTDPSRLPVILPTHRPDVFAGHIACIGTCLLFWLTC